MDENARLARNAYLRMWRKEHPDKLKEYREGYWMRRAARMLAENSNDRQPPAGQEGTPGGGHAHG